MYYLYNSYVIVRLRELYKVVLGFIIINKWNSLCPLVFTLTSSHVLFFLLPSLPIHLMSLGLKCLVLYLAVIGTSRVALNKLFKHVEFLDF